MEQNFIKRKGLRTYTKSLPKANDMLFEEVNSKKENAKVPLSTKDAVKYLLEGTLRLRVCRYCLSVTSELSELDEILVIGIHGSTHEVTIKDMVASFHPYKINEDANFPNKICRDCVNHTIDCYLFAQKCEQSERALRNCFDDMYEKMEKLDPLEPVKKRGKRKQNPNHNTLYTEHNNVISYAEPIINIVNIDNFPIPSHEINELECQKCWQALPNMESLVNHEKSHPKTMWYNCKICGKSFVKRYHLKRHLKESHLFDNEDNNRVNLENFKCNECGTISKTLGDHLQHMEKHKFKVMLKELMERKVDNLCSVCLEKGSRMTNLGEVISLYGGYKDLTGDRSIQNILNATIPEQNSHKYRELLVSNSAAIFKIVQRPRNTNTKIIKRVKVLFEFSNPILNEAHLELDEVCATYTFSKPLLVNPFKVYKEDLIKNAETELNTDILDINVPDYKKVDSMATDNKNLIEKIVQSCKLCWIFKKPSCKDCLKQCERNYKETCKHCCIFEKSEKCTFCENNNKIIKNTTSYKKEVCNLCWIFQNIGKCDTCKVSIDISGTEATNFNVNEEKNAKELPFLSKTEWKCNICLTINKNTYQCICCDKNNDNNKKMDVLSQNYPLDNKFKGYLNECPKITTEVFKTVNQNKFVLNIEKNSKYGQNLMQLYDSQNITVTKVDNTAAEDMSMDIEITPIHNFDSELKNNDIEAMDFEENDTLINCQQTMANFTQQCTKKLDFSNRPGFLNTRRAKRPLRRMATPFQK